MDVITGNRFSDIIKTIKKPRSIYNQTAANFYSHRFHLRVQTYSPFSSRTVGRIGGRFGRICLLASASVEKIRLYGSRITHSSALLLNRIVTNDDDDVTTNAFVTYFPQMRKYTCWPGWYLSFIVSPSFYIELMFIITLRSLKGKNRK